MGKSYEVIDEKIECWISHQKLFFIATAPLGADTLVNCSPKGRDTLRVLGPKVLAYMDGDGSGIETVAHLKENGRIVLMMCAFDGPPKIYRFHGLGEVIEPHHPSFDELREKFPEGNCRSIIKIAVTKISDSCGYGVPNYEYKGEKASYGNLMKQVTSADLQKLRKEKNEFSLDGLPGLEGDAE